jgi:hypothetical protein
MSVENDWLANLRAAASQERVDEITLSTNICWFCDKPKATKRCASEVYLHGNFRTEFGLTSHRHQWEELRRKIPCCLDCRMTHDKAKSWSSVFAWLGGISGLILGIVLPFFIYLKLDIKPTDNFNGVVLFSIFGGIVLGAILGYLSGRKLPFAFSRDTKPVKYATQHPVVASLIEQGWRFGKPN